MPFRPPRVSMLSQGDIDVEPLFGRKLVTGGSLKATGFTAPALSGDVKTQIEIDPQEQR